MLKQFFKKEKGFTLVELLAVIVILGIILAIAVPAIGNVIDNSKDKADEANEKLFIEAARLADLAGEVSDGKISLGDLQDKGYLVEIPKKPDTETQYESDSEVTITTDANGKKVYEYGGTTIGSDSTTDSDTGQD